MVIHGMFFNGAYGHFECEADDCDAEVARLREQGHSMHLLFTAETTAEYEAMLAVEMSRFGRLVRAPRTNRD